MSRDVAVRCRCGEVQGRLRGVAPSKVNRVVCYCGDCQAFLHWLDRADLLDPQGGSDIVQFAPSSLTFERGAERIVGMRLSAKGLSRWYASCCKTPLGNTVSPAVPFIGLLRQAVPELSTPSEQAAVFGRGFPVQGKSAIGTPPEGSVRPSLRMIAHVIRLFLGWKLGGKAWPHPFYDRTSGAPTHALVTLPPPERDALRPLCGRVAAERGDWCRAQCQALRMPTGHREQQRPPLCPAWRGRGDPNASRGSHARTCAGKGRG